MTHDVCFDFCRGVPEMEFFGIVNGRDCYCTPHFIRMASDSSACDAVCEGNPTLMCGSKQKSSVFAMHMCDNTAEDLKQITEQVVNISEELRVLNKIMLTFTGLSEDVATQMQKDFGRAGDPRASDLMQQVKQWAGTNVHAAEDGVKLADKLDSLEGRANNADSKDFSKMEDVKWAEDLIAEMKATLEAAKATLEANKKLRDQAQPPSGRALLKEDKIERLFVAKQYYQVMYFVDKEYEHKPQTCTGDQIGKPLLNYEEFQCAEACDALPGKCVGFNFFSDGQTGVCFLFSKFKTAQYYTSCADKKKIGFLLRANHSFERSSLRMAAETPAKDPIDEANWESTGGGVCEKDLAACHKAEKKVKSCIPDHEMFDVTTNAECSAKCDADSTCTGYSVAQMGCFVWKNQAVWATQRQETQWGYQCVVKRQQVELAEENEEEKTKVDPPPDPKPLPATDIIASCNVKLSRYEGLSLKPDPSGKCDLCLEELTRAERCFD